MYQLNSHKPNNVVEIHTYMHFIFYWNGSINITGISFTSFRAGP